MRRLLHHRVFSLALSLWLPLFMSGAEWVVHCPTHGGSAHGASTAAAPAHGPSSPSSLADHDHGAGESAPTDHGSSHNCSCPGPGCGTAAVAVVPTTALPLAFLVAGHEATAVATLDRFASESDHVLPFATAPPTAALAPAATLHA